MSTARPYQVKTFDLLRDAYWGVDPVKRVLLEMATGAGKTFLFCHILKTLASSIDKEHPSGWTCWMAVRGRDLVEQASQRLAREKVPHGVMMAKHWNWNPRENIQICSIDTIRSRKIRPAKLDFIVIDEVHMATTAAYEEFLAEYPNALTLGVTATPWPRKSLHKLAERVVKPVTFKELVEQGYLVPPRYICPGNPNLKGVQMVGDDYNQKQLAKAVDKMELTGDIVDHWKQRGEDRPTLGYAVNVLHSRHLAERFNQAGITAVHCDADTPADEREKAKNDHQSGKIKILFNVNIWSTGVDMPWLSCIIMARPTKSRILYVQQAGRGTRPYKGKDNFILLDHGGNVRRHGLISDEWVANVLPEGAKLGKFEASESVTICENFGCFTAYRGPVCPVCGRVNEVKTEIKTEKAGTLVELTSEDILLMQLKATRKKKNWSHKWVWDKFVVAFGKQAALDIGLKEPRVPQFIKDKYAAKRSLEREADEFLKARAG